MISILRQDKNKFTMFFIYIIISLVLMGIMLFSKTKLEQENKKMTNKYEKVKIELENLNERNQKLDNIILELQEKIENLEQEKKEIEEAKAQEAKRKEELAKAQEAKRKQEAVKARESSSRTAKANKIPSPTRGKKGRTDIFSATAYDLTFESCGKHPSHSQYGITSSSFSLIGKDISDRFIAVDPKVIELGSVVHIEFFEPYTHLTGNYTAVDTGGAIKGKRVDIFFGGQNVVKQVSDFGRREVKVSY